MSWQVISKLLYSFAINFNKIKTRPIFPKMPFYAVAKGRTPGIFMTWGDCEAQVKGFSGARYKKFDAITSAQEFINNEGAGGGYSKIKTNSKPNGNNIQSVSSTNSNLKRSFSTSSNNNRHSNATSSKTSTVRNKKEPPKKAKVRRRTTESDTDSDFSNISDDLTTIINKQMDDIEKRLKNSEKTINKIVQQTTSKNTHKKTIVIEPPQPKKRKSNSNSDFEIDPDGYVLVYTDGACSANGTKGARAGLGVYWGEGHALNASEPVSGRATNNCGEIQAASMAIKQAIQSGIKKLSINTDSQFLINSVTKWIPGWKRKGWKLASGAPVKNEVDFKELDGLQKQIAIKWNYVEAHKGIHGNEMADQLAKEGAARYSKRS